MDPFDRSRNMSSTAVESQSAYSFHTNNHYQLDPPHISLPPDSNGEDKSDSNAPFMKGPKRKRLAKVGDNCSIFDPNLCSCHTRPAMLVTKANDDAMEQVCLFGVYTDVSQFF